MEEKTQQNYQTEKSAKPYRSFTSLAVYEEVFPIVIKTIQILQSAGGGGGPGKK